MNEEMLVELSTIKTLQIAILTLLGLIVFGQFAKFVAKLIRDWTTNKEKAFTHIASDLYDKGKYQELSEYCEDRTSKWNGNPYPIYWLARAEVKLGNVESAEELLEKVLDMEPEWENSVRPHLDKLKTTNKRL